MWSAILSDANEIRKTGWAPGRAAGVGEAGKGLPLTSQRSQTGLLGPVYSQLPKPWSPGKAEPTSFLGHHPRPCPEGRTAVGAQGRTQPPHPRPPQGLLGSPPSPGARGTRWWAGRGIARKPASSSLHLGQDTPLCSQSDLLTVITIPIPPLGPRWYWVPGNLHTGSKR